MIEITIADDATPAVLAATFADLTEQRFQNSEERRATLRLYAEALLKMTFKDLQQEYIKREVRRRAEGKSAELPPWKSPKNGLLD